jgi:hypothetical protein
MLISEIKVYAVYGRSLKLLVALGVMFLIEIVTTFVLANIWSPPSETSSST